MRTVFGLFTILFWLVCSIEIIHVGIVAIQQSLTPQRTINGILAILFGLLVLCVPFYERWWARLIALATAAWFIVSVVAMLL